MEKGKVEEEFVSLVLLLVYSTQQGTEGELTQAARAKERAIPGSKTKTIKKESVSDTATGKSEAREAVLKDTYDRVDWDVNLHDEQRKKGKEGA
ncbi:hypothetical protein BCV70DRAFT_69516 [Testicularia cyperi]|uniref:Uncharacterized protein n=1 Tax=Testicularia cyperi TaxID=1882483 RepID=A0A317XJ04_9BASI|nr:hypothetical protein BCV70DRAFT_69516 [Testicularia cyperi]